MLLFSLTIKIDGFCKEIEVWIDYVQQTQKRVNESDKLQVEEYYIVDVENREKKKQKRKRGKICSKNKKKRSELHRNAKNWWFVGLFTFECVTAKFNYQSVFHVTAIGFVIVSVYRSARFNDMRFTYARRP